MLKRQMGNGKKWHVNFETTFRLQAWAAPQSAGYAGHLVAVRMDATRFRKVLPNSGARHRSPCAKRTLVR